MLKLFRGPPECWNDPPAIIQKLNAIGHLTLAINSSANFLVYVAWGTKFRKAFVRAKEEIWTRARSTIRRHEQLVFKHIFYAVTVDTFWKSRDGIIKVETGFPPLQKLRILNMPLTKLFEGVNWNSSSLTAQNFKGQELDWHYKINQTGHSTPRSLQQ